MQNRYAGDIGDYVKLALLRALGAGKRVGVAWYLFPDESHNADGRHTSYLASPKHWRGLDPELFDALAELVTRTRSVSALEQALGERAAFVSTPIATAHLPAGERCGARTEWFEQTCRALAQCDLVFADPDNGLVDDEPRRRRTKDFGKKIPLSESLALATDRPAVIYHHNSRFKGGHDAEVDHWLRQFGCPAIAVRATAYSCRTFFILNPDEELATRALVFCDRWKDHKVRMHKASDA